MPRYFNTTGPCEPADHYFLPSAVRMPELAPFIERKQYFVMHAPRQTGKTTAMRTFAAALREQGIAGCWATLERCQGPRTIIAAITALHTAARLLSHLDLPTDLPTLARARAPPQLELDELM